MLVALSILSACDTFRGGPSGRLTANGEAAGFRVATDGQTAVVGVSDGSVSVYGLGPNGWAHEADLDPPGDDGDSKFGWSVAVDGDVVVVGALGEGGTFESPRGAAYVYERRENDWVETARLNPTDIPSPRLYGRAVAVSEGRVIISSARVRGSGEPEVVQVYERAGDVWALVQTAAPPDPERTREFGKSLAIGGSTLVVGATLEGDGAVAIGAVYVYRLGGGADLIATLPEPPGLGVGNGFGLSVSTDGSQIVVGSPAADVGQDRSVGAAFVYEDSGGAWTLSGRLDNPEPTSRDFFAESVGTDDGIVVVGSESEDQGRGAVFTFERQGGEWAPRT